MICPVYISNRTADVCVGDIIINSPEVGMALLFAAMVIIPTCICFYLGMKGDAKGRKHDE